MMYVWFKVNLNKIINSFKIIGMDIFFERERKYMKFYSWSCDMFMILKIMYICINKVWLLYV